MARWFSKRREQTPDPLVLELEVAVIDAVLSHCRPGTQITFGAPTRCPRCGDFGFVDLLDPIERATWNTCFTCGNEWVITVRALQAHRRRPSQAAPALHSSAAGATIEAPRWADAGRDEPLPGTRARPIVITATNERDMARAARYVQPLPVAGASRPVPSSRLKLLLVEDDPTDAELVRTVFAPFEERGVSVVHAETRSEGERIVGRRPDIDLVLLDLGLPDSNGLSTLSHWREHPTPPVVILSGNDNPGLVDATRQLGAALYVHKHQLIDLTDQGADDLVATLRRVTAGAGA